MPKRLTAIITAIIIFITILFSSALVRLYTDWLWFKQMGYAELFSTPLKAEIIIAGIVGLITFILLYCNLIITQHGRKASLPTFRFEQGKIQLDITKYTKPIAIIAIAFLSLLTALAAGGNWEIILRHFNAVPFNSVDPIFGRDIGFYFFTLPFIQLILGLVTWIIILALITAAVMYISNPTTPSILNEEGKISLRHKKFLNLEGKTYAHISALIALFFTTIACRIWYVKIPNLLYSTTGPFTGASYTDLHAHLPLLKLLAVLASLVAIIFIINIFRKKYLLIIGAVSLYVVIALVGQVYPLAMQKFIVLPNELVKESPSIARNISATQVAFGLNTVEERDLSGDTRLTKKDLEKNQASINNIRLWDREPLLDTFGQLQEIRTYYDFVSIDNDRYTIDKEYRQVLLSPRELNTESLPSDTFINKYLTFTHGYGLTLGPVNEVTSEGLPLLFVKDIPPKTDFPELEIKRPEIYYGELAHDPVFVKTAAQEFDYPSGDENVFSEYVGAGGVPIKNILRKAIFALRFGSLKMLLSNDIQNDSRVMYYRDIQRGVARAMPFLRLDSDPYLVITKDGNLKWIYDGYTESNKYPYAEQVAESGSFHTMNYIRNSVKIVIDAYDGSTRFYVADPQDPIIQTYIKIFPNSFTPLTEIPDDLRAHLRYPEDLFAIQTALYKTYHMQEPQTFYNKEDEWQIPAFGESNDTMMRHLIMKLPGEQQEEFILMLPFTPRGKDNLSAWMVARSDGDQYGKLVVYRFPKQQLVYGPKQIVNRINQDPEISQQISLWDQKGSRVIHGNLLVIPIEKSLLYVQPLYIKADNGKIPELKRVIVAYENQIAMAENLDRALARIFSGTTNQEVEPRVAPAAEAQPRQQQSQSDLLRQANTHYNNALNAQRAGNWTRYGEEIKLLGEILRELGK